MAWIETNDGLWFHEDLYPEISCGFRVSAVLHRERSAFQDIVIIDTPVLGKVLVLDGIVQCAQKDEAIYHEMLAHAGMFLRLTLAPVATGPGAGGARPLSDGSGPGGRTIGGRRETSAQAPGGVAGSTGGSDRNSGSSGSAGWARRKLTASAGGSARMYAARSSLAM